MHDDADAVREKMIHAYELVFATPIYYYEMSGVMKTTLDMANPHDSNDSMYESLPDGVTFEGASLVLESETVMNLFFTNTTGQELTFTTSDEVTLT